MIGNEFPGKTSDDKTSISLSLKNEQGALLKVLQIVNKNKKSISQISYQGQLRKISGNILSF